MENQQTASFILASRLATYPNQEVASDVVELISNVPEFFPGLSGDLFSEVREHALTVYNNSDEVRSLASRYIDIFDRGSSDNSLYETEYGLRRSQLKTTELADIAGFYEAFGFRLSDVGDRKELHDHIALECEFYALLIAKEAFLQQSSDKEGVEIVRDARKKFLQDHLGRFPRAIAERPLVGEDPFYALVFRWIADLVEHECDRLDVGVVPVNYRDGTDQDGEISCGSSDSIVSSIGGRAR